LESRQNFRRSATSVASFLKDRFARVIQQHNGGKTFARFRAEIEPGLQRQIGPFSQESHEF
jgi:hypothetical protein